MSSRKYYRQAESAVPRTPHETISIGQAQVLLGSLTRARAEYINLITQFPPGHPTIRVALADFPDLSSQEFDRLISEARRLMSSIRSNAGRPVQRERARDECILYGQVDRQLDKLREDLEKLNEKFRKREYDHLRYHRQHCPYRPMGPPQAPFRPPPPRLQTSRPAPPSPQPSRPAYHRRLPSYEELLEETEFLQSQNRRLEEQLDTADRIVDSLEVPLRWCRETIVIYADEDEDEEEWKRRGKRRRL